MPSHAQLVVPHARPSGHFNFSGNDLIDRFDALLDGLESDVQIVTARDIIALGDSGSLAIDGVAELNQTTSGVAVAISTGKTEINTHVQPNNEKTVARICPICNGKVTEDYSGKQARKCDRCGSLERQRVFHGVYDRYLRHEFDLSQKKTLAVCVVGSERLMYKQFGMIDITSCDVRPDVNADITCDICNMPQIPDNSYDCVIASFIFQLVHDLDGALSEIRRILRPSGRLLSWDNLRFGEPTITVSETASKAYYGEDNFEKYKLGHFRQFGDLDLIGKFQQFFLVKTFYGIDPGTGERSVWMCGVNLG